MDISLAGGPTSSKALRREIVGSRSRNQSPISSRSPSRSQSTASLAGQQHQQRVKFEIDIPDDRLSSSTRFFSGIELLPRFWPLCLGCFVLCSFRDYIYLTTFFHLLLEGSVDATRKLSFNGENVPENVVDLSHNPNVVTASSPASHAELPVTESPLSKLSPGPRQPPPSPFQRKLPSPSLNSDESYFPPSTPSQSAPILLSPIKYQHLSEPELAPLVVQRAAFSSTLLPVRLPPSKNRPQQMPAQIQLPLHVPRPLPLPSLNTSEAQTS